MTCKSSAEQAKGSGLYLLSKLRDWSCTSLAIVIMINLVITGAIFFSTNKPIDINNTLQPFYPPEVPKDLTISAWNPYGFGMRSPGQDMGTLIIYFNQAVFRDPWTSEFIFLVAPFWLSSVAMYLLLKKGRISNSKPVLVIGSLVYAYNWLTLQYIGVNVMMYVYPVFPLVVLSMLRIFFQNESWTLNALLLGVTLSLGTMFLTLQGISFMLPFFFAGFICWLVSSGKSIRNALKSFMTIALGFIIFVALSLPFTLPTLIGVLKLGIPGYATSAKYVVGANDFLAYLQPHYFDSYLPNPISELLVLTSPNISGWLAVGGLLIFFVAMLPLMPCRKRIRLMSFGLSVTFLLVILMIKLIKLRSHFIQVIYSSLQFIWPINGADVYMLILAGLLSIMFAFGLEVVMQKRRKITDIITSRKEKNTRIHKIFFCFLVATLIAASAGSALLSHNMLLIQPKAFSNGEFSSPYPEYVQDLANTFNKERELEGPFRVLWVPQTSWVVRLVITKDVLSHYQPSGLGNDELFRKFETLAAAFNVGQTSLGRQLTLLGFRYVVVLRDIPETGPIIISSGHVDRYLTGAPANFEKSLDAAFPDVELVERTQSYSLYKNNLLCSNWHGILFDTSNDNVLVENYSQLNIKSYVIGDDHQWENWSKLNATWWAPTGQIAVATDSAEKINGSDSLKWTMTAGEDGKLEAGIWRWFSSPWGSENIQSISIYLYGTKKEGEFSIVLSSDESSNSYVNTAEWIIPDDFVGWRNVKLYLNDFSYKYNAWNPSRIYGILIKYKIGGLDPQGKIDVFTNQITFNAFSYQLPDSDFEELQILEMSPQYAPTTYLVEVHAPSWLVFLQNYDPGWNAYVICDNGARTQLEHTTYLGWANAFRVSGSGESRVLLLFEPQADRDTLLLTWMIVAPLAVLSPIFYSFIPNLKKRRASLTQRWRKKVDDD